MRTKTINLLLILTSLIGYLEWGTNNSMFLFQGEWDILKKLVDEPLSVLHPFVLLPLAGQIVLLITLFQKEPSKVLTRIGIIGLGLLLVFIFVIGLIGLNFKTAFSVLPFIVTAIVAIRNR